LSGFPFLPPTERITMTPARPTHARPAPAVLLLLLLTGGGAAGAQDAPLDCLIRPKELVRLSTPVQGIIAEVAVDRGDAVARGDVVARLDSRIEEATLALAELRAHDTAALDIARARADLLASHQDRTRRLREHVSASRAEEAEAEARMAGLAVRQAQTEQALNRLALARDRALLDRRTIRSPVDGLVVERLMAPGEFRNEQDHVVTIARMDPLLVDLHAPLERWGTIRTGDAAWVVPEAPIGGRHKAVVTVVDRVFDSASGTFGVRLELPNPDGALPAGLRCTARFPGE